MTRGHRPAPNTAGRDGGSEHPLRYPLDGEVEAGWSCSGDTGRGSAAVRKPSFLDIDAEATTCGPAGTPTRAALRHETDERQEYHRLQVQALVGKVMSLAVAVAYLVAVTAKVQLWPFAIFLGLAVAAQLAGRVLYRDHHDDGLAER